MDLNLEGKAALISGASAGIGRVTAKTLAREGVQTIVIARRAAELEALADEIRGKGNPVPALIVDDLLDDESYDRVVPRVMGDFGGRGHRRQQPGSGPAVRPRHDGGGVERGVRLNFMTPRRLTTPFIAGMRERGFGPVICLTATSERLTSAAR